MFRLDNAVISIKTKYGESHQCGVIDVSNTFSAAAQTYRISCEDYKREVVQIKISTTYKSPWDTDPILSIAEMAVCLNRINLLGEIAICFQIQSVILITTIYTYYNYLIYLGATKFHSNILESGTFCIASSFL